jgi:pumilio homology domain family member 6
MFNLIGSDSTMRNDIISEFYGHVKRLINHPEAAWIMDDAYRGAATRRQKAIMLREWYGPDFALFKASDDVEITAELSEILRQSPEKRKPILDHLFALINSLIQKKLVAFTMLHDALLQYYLNISNESAEMQELHELLKGKEENEEADLLKNLAFTASGSFIVCHLFAVSDAKERRNLLKVYKGVWGDMALDQHAVRVVLTVFDALDDTRQTVKMVLTEIIGPDSNRQEQLDQISKLINHPVGRLPLLYVLAGPSQAFMKPADTEIMQQVASLRSKTSKKDPIVRRREILDACSKQMLNVIVDAAESLLTSKEGCLFTTECLLNALPSQGGQNEEHDLRVKAWKCICNAALESNKVQVGSNTAKLFKTIVQGGHYDPSAPEGSFTSCSQSIDPGYSIPVVAFGETFCDAIMADTEKLLSWSTGPASFVVVALVESKVLGEERRMAVTELLKNKVAALQEAANGSKEKKGNAGAKVLLDLLR